MNIRQLSALNPVTAEDEQLIMEKFASRAKSSRLDELRAVDVRFGWQEEILNPIIEDRMATMPQDNDPVLSNQDQAILDKPDLTKEEELALQAKLDAAKAKKKVHAEEVAESIETELEPVPTDEVPEAPTTKGKAKTKKTK